MSTGSETKINQLLQNIPQGTVILSSWLLKQGYSRELQHRYIKSGWLQSIGYGALIRKGDKVNLHGALYSLQQQAFKKIHIGGRSALGMQGLSHYLELYQKETLLFAPHGIKLPLWFKRNTWESVPVLTNTSMLPHDIGLVEFQTGSFSLNISSPARALMECLHLTPDRFELIEASQIMESLASLRPEKTQEILENCQSVKVTRLFLFLADKSNHSWVKYLNTERINLGSGKRSIVPNGIYIPKYKITVPGNLIDI